MKLGQLSGALQQPMASDWRCRPSRGCTWSGAQVAATTLARAQARSLRVEVLPQGYDVDDGDGLRRLEVDLSRPEIAARAPATSRALRLLF